MVSVRSSKRTGKVTLPRRTPDQVVYRDSVRCRKNRLPDGGGRILLGTMIRGGFLTAEERRDLTELARDGLAEHRLARRANALVLLDRGMSCEEVGRVLLIDDD